MLVEKPFTEAIVKIIPKGYKMGGLIISWLPPGIFK